MRYLRRKKERRKVKSKVPATANTDKSDDDAYGDKEELYAEDAADAVGETAVQVTQAEQREHRPKKRRKITEPPEDVAMEDAYDETQQFDRPTENLPRTQSPEATLPSFPLPALPDAPSTSILALQGLDQALIDAEIVDPATLMTIPDGEDSGGTGLNEKIRKRLKDLGITELFAGMYCMRSDFLFHEPFSM